MIKKFKIWHLEFGISSKRAFTIVELSIYMGLMSVLIFVMTDIVVTVLDRQTEATQTSAVEQDGRFILARFSYDLRKVLNKSNLLLPAALGNSGNELKIIIGGTTYDYTLDTNTGNLNLTTDAGATQNQLNSYASVVSNLTFQRIGNAGNTSGKDTIKINFTLTSRAKRPEGIETRSFQTTIAIR